MSSQGTSADPSLEGRCSLGAYSGGPEAKVGTRQPKSLSPDSSSQSLPVSKNQARVCGVFSQHEANHH